MQVYDNFFRKTDTMNNLTIENSQQPLKKLFLTEFNTIYGEDFAEIPFKNFCKKMRKKINEGSDNSVKYDKEKQKFFVYLDKEQYVLEMNEEIIKNYGFGVFDKTTMLLDMLVKESASDEEKKKLSEKIKQKENDSIIKIEEENRMPTLAEASIYLKHLKRENKEKGKEIIKNSALFGVSFSPPVLAMSICGVTLGPEYIPVGIVAGGFSFLMIGMDAFGENWEKRSFATIKKALSKIRTNNYKLRQIKKMKNIDKVVDPVSYTVESFDKTVDVDVKANEQNFKDKVMKDINRIVDRISYVNAEDRESLLNEAKSILEEYSARYRKIQNQNDDNIDLEADNELKLKIDITTRISFLETKLLEVRNKDIKISSHENEKILLEEKIEDNYKQLEIANIESYPKVRKRTK